MHKRDDYVQRIRMGLARIDLEGAIAPGRVLTIHHLVVAILSLPEVSGALTNSGASYHIDSVRMALTGGEMFPERAPHTQAGLHLRAPKAMIYDRSLERCLQRAMAFEDEAGLPSYARLLACAVRAEPSICETLHGEGVAPDVLVHWIRQETGDAHAF